MTKSQIKAELRRSACEDVNPPRDCLIKAWVAACSFEQYGEYSELLTNDDQRTFFLLVAEAL